MKERPIRMDSGFIPALLNGTKTQTRRLMNKWDFLCACTKNKNKDTWTGTYEAAGGGFDSYDKIKCPYKIGDRLFVKESFWLGKGAFHGFGTEPRPYKYDKKINSYFMMEGDSRITLEITNIRVERLWNLTFHDCHAEAMFDKPKNKKYPFSAVESFKLVKKVLDLEIGNCAKENPWVWVYEFKRVKP